MKGNAALSLWSDERLGRDGRRETARTLRSPSCSSRKNDCGGSGDCAGGRYVCSGKKRPPSTWGPFPDRRVIAAIRGFGPAMASQARALGWRAPAG
jgi:hypothetical protein